MFLLLLLLFGLLDLLSNFASECAGIRIPMLIIFIFVISFIDDVIGTKISFILSFLTSIFKLAALLLEYPFQGTLALVSAQLIGCLVNFLILVLALPFR